MTDPRQLLVTGGALKGPLLERLLNETAPEPPLPEGHPVGPFRIRSVLGTGGTSYVYLADRDDGQFEQEVALKLIRPNSSLADRFRKERQTLAGLRHEGIARFIDGGESENGQLWFAMEPVLGSRIDEFVKSSGLSWQRRLGLYLQICDSLAYAHSRLIVHRDIKPANILVDEHGKPRLLDFGIALVNDPEAGRGDHALTPGYASPEQTAGDEVTTASDIYQLGLLLKRIMALDDGEAPADAVPMPRATRLDLQAIARRACATAPADRYASVPMLRLDVTAVLESLPVSARDGGIVYRGTRFVRRNSLAVATAALGIAALVAFGVWDVIRVSRERDAASVAAERAEALSTFLLSLFRVSDPGENRGETLTAAELLARGENTILADTGGTSSFRLALALEIGRVYVELGELNRAAAFMTKVADAPGGAQGAAEFSRASLLNELGWSLVLLGKQEDARARLEESLLILGRMPNDSARELEIAKAKNRLGACEYRAGNPPRARQLYQEALDIRMRLLPENDQLIAGPINNLAALDAEAGNFARALANFSRAEEVFRQSFGSEHPRLVMTGRNIAEMKAELGDYAGAETAIDTAMALGEKLNYPMYTSDLLATRALIRIRQVKYQEAVELAAEADRIFLASGQGSLSSSNRTQWLKPLGMAQLLLGDNQQALVTFEELVALRSQPTQDGRPNAARLGLARVYRGKALVANGQVARGVEEIRAGLDMLTPDLPPGHPDLVEARLELLAATMAMGDTDRIRTEQSNAARAISLVEDEPIRVRLRGALDQLLEQGNLKPHIDVGATREGQ